MPQLHPTPKFFPMSDNPLTHGLLVSSLQETDLDQPGRANVVSAQMRTLVSPNLTLHMQEASIFCPYQRILPPSSARLPSWWSVARPTSTNGNGRTSVWLFLGLVRAHGGLPPSSRIEARLGIGSDQPVTTPGNQRPYKVEGPSRYAEWYWAINIEGHKWPCLAQPDAGASQNAHDGTHSPSSAPRPVVVGAQGVRDRYSQPQQVRSRQAYLLSDRRKRRHIVCVAACLPFRKTVHAVPRPHSSAEVS